MIPHSPPISVNVFPGDPAYTELLEISIAADSMTLSMAAHQLPDFDVNIPRVFRWQSKRNLLRVEIQTDGLLREIYRSESPVLSFNILPNKEPEAAPEKWNKDKKDVALNVAGYAFVTFYERMRGPIAVKFSSDINQCPELVRFAWKVRNAVAHSGYLGWSNKSVRPVYWRNIHLSQADDGMLLIGPVIDVADLVILMLDLQEALEN